KAKDVARLLNLSLEELNASKTTLSRIDITKKSEHAQKQNTLVKAAHHISQESLGLLHLSMMVLLDKAEISDKLQPPALCSFCSGFFLRHELIKTDPIALRYDKIAWDCMFCALARDSMHGDWNSRHLWSVRIYKPDI